MQFITTSVFNDIELTIRPLKIIYKTSFSLVFILSINKIYFFKINSIDRRKTSASKFLIFIDYIDSIFLIINFSLYQLISLFSKNNLLLLLIQHFLFPYSIHGDELVTPFAQVLSSLKSVRSNFVLLTNIRQNRLRRGSEGFHLNSRLCQLYEINDGSMIRDDMYKKVII